MKLELKIEAPGVQVYAYEIDAATKELIKENEANGSIYREPMEIVEEHAKVTLISHGIAPRNEGCKYTAIIDGEEKAFFPCMFEYAEIEDFENSDNIEMAIQDYGSPDNVDADDHVWIPIGDYDLQHLGAKEDIAEGHTVIFEVIPYSSGTLHTSFEVANDFKLRDLKLIIDNPDTNEEYDLSWLYYCNVFDGILDQNGDKPFDEDTIRAVDYKGERHDFHLDFQGGSGWYEAHEKGEDGWFPSYLVNGKTVDEVESHEPTGINVFSTKEDVMRAVGEDAYALHYASKEMKADREVVMIAVKNWGAMLQEASAELKADREIVLAAVENTGGSLQYASKEIRADREVVMTAIAENGYAIGVASEELRADKELALAAVKHDPGCFEEIAEKLQSDPEILAILP